MTAPTVTSETMLTPERVRELRDGFKRDAKVPDDLSSDPASGLYHEIVALCDHWLSTQGQVGLTGEQREACFEGASYLTHANFEDGTERERCERAATTLRALAGKGEA